MKLLALETSSLACSVALEHDGGIVERHALAERQHTRLVVPMIGEVLDAAGLAPADLDAVVLGNGPGSFIGLRIAASVAQGLCYGAGLPLVPVSSLAAVAAEVFRTRPVERVLVAQDAHMEEVYLAAFRRGADDLPVAEGEAVLHPPGRIARLQDAESWHAAGAGWQRYPALLAANEARLAGVLDVAWPRARDLLALGRRAWQAGEAIDPQALVPAYVRDRVTA
ncbi:MAG TPA: tRNA (adenosine(37)-N6)-threonylcarbamoyltransferase complex dimerization subunit type 1 TsaB [Woeseiaceae bacterium]|nr:tRNA (adenosine(37)-N6)-threonylcarbamoyltransferase complex dimerization subunit type 1 TsaB [Woeseiaceae bacterium]